MRSSLFSFLAGGVALFAASSVLAGIHAPVVAAAPKTSPLPGRPVKSPAVANLLASVKQKAAASTVAQKAAQRTTPSGLLVYNPGDSAEVALLRNVYSTLALADHDYKGHRAHAMHEVASAARILGGHLHGDGKAGEKQPVSDGQLRNAQGMLSTAATYPAAARNAAVNKHLHSAINHLGIALAIK